MEGWEVCWRHAHQVDHEAGRCDFLTQSIDYEARIRYESTRRTYMSGRKSAGGVRTQLTIERADSRKAFSLYTTLLRAPPALPTCGTF